MVLHSILELPKFVLKLVGLSFFVTYLVCVLPPMGAAATHPTLGHRLRPSGLCAVLHTRFSFFQFIFWLSTHFNILCGCECPDFPITFINCAHLAKDRKGLSTKGRKIPCKDSRMGLWTVEGGHGHMPNTTTNVILIIISNRIK